MAQDPQAPPAADPDARYGPGWAGDVVLLWGLDEHDDRLPLAVATTNPETGSVEASDDDLVAEWERDGITGREANGTLYPKDGQRFLDELPFVYRGTRVWAEPAGVPIDRVQELL